MSKVFYDHLIVFEDLEVEIKEVAKTSEEREELWQIVDEIIHHKVLGCVFDKLPQEYHDEFLNKFHKAPYDDGIIAYIDDKLDVEDSIEKVIRKELKLLANEILQELFDE
jgi:hypothetical protein